jgi:cytochrome P450
MAAQIPGPKGHWLLGSAKDFIERPIPFLRDVVSTYGDVSHIRLGPSHAYVIAHPDMVHDVLVERAEIFGRERSLRKVMSEVIGMGQGLVVSEGDLWKRQRKLMQPAFHHKRISTYADVTVQYTQAFMAQWQDGQTIDMKLAMSSLTLSIVTKALFNVDGENSSVKQFTNAIDSLQHIAASRFRSPISLPDWLPTPQNLTMQRCHQLVDEVVLGIVEDRRKSNSDTGDLLSMLIQAVDEDDKSQMTNQQLRDEAVTLYLAGYDTTTLSLLWTWYLLAKNPDIAAKVYDEIDRVLEGRPATFKDLPTLSYTQMVFREVLRMYPSAWFTTRAPKEDVVMGGYTIPAGSMVIIPIHAIHHDPRWWEAPDIFMPERFSEGYEKRIPKYAYFPFGGGPRICIGQQFAMMENVLATVTIAQHFRPELLSPDQIVEPDPLITIGVKGSMPMRVVTRKTVVKTHESQVTATGG